ncbi:MAG: Hsp20/alpha crystallin family protein [Deferribacterota bacterium]|nr:Hsp20/alpha crystallin family protein [Deferribacterota bacterium]
MENEFDEIVVIRGVLRKETHNIIKNLKNSRREITETPFPPVDIVVSDDKVKIYFELPGVNIDDINLFLCGDLLIIEGVKKLEKIPYKVNFLRMERITTSFRRIIHLPIKIREDNIEAVLKNGVLSVVFIKNEGG